MKKKPIKYIWKDCPHKILLIPAISNDDNACINTYFEPTLPKHHVYKRTGNYEIQKIAYIQSVLYEYVYTETI